MIQSKSKAIFLLCIIFILGMFAGASLTTFLTRPARAQGEFRGSHRDRIVEHLKNRLQLTADQVAQLHTVLDDTDRKMDELFRPLHPQQDAIFSEMQDRVRKFLSSGQKTEYDKMLQEMGKRHEKKRGGDSKGGESSK
jgi:hypothetical protein